MLAWHFPDRFYHANLDRPPMTSPTEMEHVGVTVGTTSLPWPARRPATRWTSPGCWSRPHSVVDLERRQGDALVRAAPDRTAAEAAEAAVMAAWRVVRRGAARGPRPAARRRHAELRAAVERAVERVTRQ